MRFANHLPTFRIERGKQRRGAVTFVVMCPAFDLPRPHRQNGLRAVERLDLRLLIDAEHDSAGGRIEIQPHDVAHLLDQQRVGRELEGLRAVRLQAERAPHARDRHVTEPGRLRHRTGAPVRGPTGRRLQRAHDHAFDLIVGHGSWRARPRLVVQAVQPIAHEPGAPLAHRRGRQPQSLCHDHVGDATPACCARRRRSTAPEDVTAEETIGRSMSSRRRRSAASLSCSSC